MFVAILHACRENVNGNNKFSRVTYERLAHVSFLASVARSPHSLAGFADAV